MFYLNSLKEVIKSMKPGKYQDEQLAQLEKLWGKKSWEAHRRPDQTPPPDSLWRVWVYSGGRGAGKTRTGAEETRAFADANPGSRLLIVGRTQADVRQVMIEGESGILALYEPNSPFAPVYKPSRRQLVWPNGATAMLFSAEEADALRGVQAHFTWADEVASWRPAGKDKLDAWDNVQIGTRLGSTPRIIVTTTPKKTKILKKVHRALKRFPLHYRLTEANMVLNRENLADRYVRAILDTYYETQAAKTEIKGLWPWKL